MNLWNEVFSFVFMEIRSRNMSKEVGRKKERRRAAMTVVGIVLKKIK